MSARLLPVSCRFVLPHRRLGLLLYLAAVFVTPPLPAAVPLATTQVSKLCEVQAVPNSLSDQDSTNPLPFEQVVACNLSVSGTANFGQQLTSASAEGYASAGFGPGIPQVGLATASAQIGAVNGSAIAGLTGSINYFFEILPITQPPGTAPSLIPHRF